MNINLNGKFRVHCPSCEHIHYRSIENGKITDERFTNSKDCNSAWIEDIQPMKSSCRDFQKETVKDNEENLIGFLHRLWKEKFEVV